MLRFFIASQDICDDKIVISDSSTAHHIRNVLRLKVKDRLIAFDEKGTVYHCSVTRLCPKITLTILQINRPWFPKNKLSLTVACALPKRSSMDDIVDKLTQLGVERIVPLKTKRVMVHLDEKAKQMRLLRWQRIALNASQQSRRNSLPVIEQIKDFKEVLEKSPGYDLKLMPTLSGRRRPLKEILTPEKSKTILVFIGPEGDFTPQEISLAETFGCIGVSLGNLVLRVETAAVAVTSFIMLTQ